MSYNSPICPYNIVGKLVLAFKIAMAVVSSLLSHGPNAHNKASVLTLEQRLDPKLILFLAEDDTFPSHVTHKFERFYRKIFKNNATFAKMQQKTNVKFRLDQVY